MARTKPKKLQPKPAPQPPPPVPIPHHHPITPITPTTQQQPTATQAQLRSNGDPNRIMASTTNTTSITPQSAPARPQQQQHQDHSQPTPSLPHNYQPTTNQPNGTSTAQGQIPTAATLALLSQSGHVPNAATLAQLSQHIPFSSSDIVAMMEALAGPISPRSNGSEDPSTTAPINNNNNNNHTNPLPTPNGNPTPNPPVVLKFHPLHQLLNVTLHLEITPRVKGLIQKFLENPLYKPSSDEIRIGLDAFNPHYESVIRTMSKLDEVYEIYIALIFSDLLSNRPMRTTNIHSQGRIPIFDRQPPSTSPLLEEYLPIMCDQVATYPRQFTQLKSYLLQKCWQRLSPSSPLAFFPAQALLYIVLGSTDRSLSMAYLGNGMQHGMNGFANLSGGHPQHHPHGTNLTPNPLINSLHGGSGGTITTKEQFSPHLPSQRDNVHPHERNKKSLPSYFREIEYIVATIPGNIHYWNLPPTDVVNLSFLLFSYATYCHPPFSVRNLLAIGFEHLSFLDDTMIANNQKVIDEIIKQLFKLMFEYRSPCISNDKFISYTMIAAVPFMTHDYFLTTFPYLAALLDDFLHVQTIPEVEELAQSDRWIATCKEYKFNISHLRRNLVSLVMVDPLRSSHMYSVAGITAIYGLSNENETAQYLNEAINNLQICGKVYDMGLLSVLHTVPRDPYLAAQERLENPDPDQDNSPHKNYDDFVNIPMKQPTTTVNTHSSQHQHHQYQQQHHHHQQQQQHLQQQQQLLHDCSADNCTNHQHHPPQYPHPPPTTNHPDLPHLQHHHHPSNPHNNPESLEPHPLRLRNPYDNIRTQAEADEIALSRYLQTGSNAFFNHHHHPQHPTNAPSGNNHHPQNPPPQGSNRPASASHPNHGNGLKTPVCLLPPPGGTQQHQQQQHQQQHHQQQQQQQSQKPSNNFPHYQQYQQQSMHPPSSSSHSPGYNPAPSHLQQRQPHQDVAKNPSGLSATAQHLGVSNLTGQPRYDIHLLGGPTSSVVNHHGTINVPNAVGMSGSVSGTPSHHGNGGNNNSATHNNTTPTNPQHHNGSKAGQTEMTSTQALYLQQLHQFQQLQQEYQHQRVGNRNIQPPLPPPGMQGGMGNVMSPAQYAATLGGNKSQGFQQQQQPQPHSVRTTVTPSTTSPLITSTVSPQPPPPEINITTPVTVITPTKPTQQQLKQQAAQAAKKKGKKR